MPGNRRFRASGESRELRWDSWGVLPDCCPTAASSGPVSALAACGGPVCHYAGLVVEDYRDRWSRCRGRPAMARLGVGHLVVVDPQRVDITNLPRLPESTRRDAMTWLTAADRPAVLQRLGRRVATSKVRLAERVARRARRDVLIEHLAPMPDNALFRQHRKLAATEGLRRCSAGPWGQRAGVCLMSPLVLPLTRRATRAGSGATAGRKMSRRRNASNQASPWRHEPQRPRSDPMSSDESRARSQSRYANRRALHSWSAVSPPD
jgi:hypothetical protein